MANEILAALLRANLTAAVAILAVMAARLPVRRRFGPELAYGLWALPAAAALGSLAPARMEQGVALHPGALGAAGVSSKTLLLIWLAGVVAAALAVAIAQLAFLRQARRGAAGPAVVGLICPKILMPPDDGRFTAEERAVIRAHEREHIRRRDPRGGAWMAAFQCLAWFNPLAHLAAHLARIDQELACDAAVLRRSGVSRALYARTLLKSQLAGRPLPFGCYWPAAAPHPLEIRVGLLKAAGPRPSTRGEIWLAAALGVALIAAWAVKPPSPPPPSIEDWIPAPDQRGVSTLLINVPAGSSFGALPPGWRSRRTSNPAS